MKNSALEHRRERLASYIRRGTENYLANDRTFGSSFVNAVIVSDDARIVRIFIEFRGEQSANMLLSKVKRELRTLSEKIKEQFSARFFPKLIIEKSNEEISL